MLFKDVLRFYTIRGYLKTAPTFQERVGGGWQLVVLNKRSEGQEN